MIRFDFDNQTRRCLLSWAVTPESRGKGIGSKILAAACAKFKEYDLIAEVKPNNLPSRAMVVKCGFQLHSKQSDFETWIYHGMSSPNDMH